MIVSVVVSVMASLTLTYLPYVRTKGELARARSRERARRW